MDRKQLLDAWKKEESVAHIKGWDFSHIDGRYSEETDFPFDYRAEIHRYLKSDMKLLDIDTGGGEFLLSLSHPYENTAATEGYPPNAELCRQTLLPMGIDFKEAGALQLPFEDGSFDIVINRHGDLCAKEIQRVLKKGGLFITQQVGADNDRELVKLLLGDMPLPFPNQYLDIVKKDFKENGFEIISSGECYKSIRFFDVGALVWFARIIEWEFVGFSVDACGDALAKAHEICVKNGFVEGKAHRFFLVAKKK